jgi:riboflavin synthase
VSSSHRFLEQSRRKAKKDIFAFSVDVPKNVSETGGAVFTGIIEELGKIQAQEKYAGGARIKISARVVTENTHEGDSVAVNGVCLTALDVKPDSFAADVSGETLDKSTLGSLKIGSSVNLERAVTPQTRLGGHIVQGHVDARGKFVSAVQSGDFWTVRIGFPAGIGQYLVYKGSISVEGISLTIASLADKYFEIAVIPKTWQLTNLSSLSSGDAVNLEADVIAKYVERIMLYGRQAAESEAITIEKLNKLGFV